MSEFEFLKRICIAVSRILFNMNNENSAPKSKDSYLIFPIRQKIVSEQEARFLFAQELEYTKKFYSIETPTIKKYKFSKKAKSLSSGSIDLCIHENKQLKRDIIVEFKAHACNCKKDFEKLLTEKENGLFFHLLNNVDMGTLNNGIIAHYSVDFENARSSEKA